MTNLPALALLVACCATVGCASLGPANSSAGPNAAKTPKLTDRLLAWVKPEKPKASPTPTVDPNDPALSLNKNSKPGPDVYVAMAQMLEANGKPDEAEKQYRKALSAQPKFGPALLGLAHLKDGAEQFDEATQLYKQAIAASPKEARAYNDLGLCYHRRGMLKEAVDSLERAIALQPDRKLYRNNLAAVLVELNKPQEALAQLTAGEPVAVAHYNLGYLLLKKGDQPAALAQFRAAAAADPAFDGAHQWIAKLSPTAGGPEARVARSNQAPYGSWAAPAGEAAVRQAAQQQPATDAAPQQMTSVSRQQAIILPAVAPPAANGVVQPAATAAIATPAAEAPVAVMAQPEPIAGVPPAADSHESIASATPAAPAASGPPAVPGALSTVGGPAAPGTPGTPAPSLVAALPPSSRALQYPQYQGDADSNEAAIAPSPADPQPANTPQNVADASNPAQPAPGAVAATIPPPQSGAASDAPSPAGPTARRVTTVQTK